MSEKQESQEIKVYVVSDDEIETVGGIDYKIVTSIIHYIDPNLEFEGHSFNEQKLKLDLVSTFSVPGIELVRDRFYPDGKVERLETFPLAPDTAYMLYLHFKKIDEENPDKLFW